MKRFLAFVSVATLLSLSEPTSSSMNSGSGSQIIPNNYTSIPGFGHYKLEMQPETFARAASICINDGAHLAIMTSLQEAEAVVTRLFPTNPNQQPDNKSAWLGFGDFFGKGDFYTIFGRPLLSTEYENWSSGEPRSASERNCGWMNVQGRLGTENCNTEKWYFCEIELPGRKKC